MSPRMGVERTNVVRPGPAARLLTVTGVAPTGAPLAAPSGSWATNLKVN